MRSSMRVNVLPWLTLACAALGLARDVRAMGAPSERRSWRWYENNSDQRPRPATNVNESRFGVRAGEVLRLRRNVYSTIYGAGPYAIVYTQTFGSCRPITEYVPIGKSGAFWTPADGLGVADAPLEESLLEDSDGLGVFSEGATFSQVMGASVGEVDVALRVPQERFVAARRTQFGLATLSSTGVPTLPVTSTDCRGPVACTEAGAPTLALGMEIPPSLDLEGARSVTMVDWTGDGLDDLVVPRSAHLVLYEGTAPLGISFRAPRVLVEGNAPLDVPAQLSGADVADWDGDGNLDVLFATEQSALYWRRNEGAGMPPTLGPLQPISVTNLLSGPSSMSVRMVDWQADGVNDLLLGTATRGVWVALNSGTNAAAVLTAQAALGGTFSGSTYAEFFDWDADGKRDLVMANGYYGYLGFYKNTSATATPSFAALVQATIPSDLVTYVALPFVARDLNADARVDLLVFSNSSTSYPVVLYNAAAAGAPVFDRSVAPAVDGTSFDDVTQISYGVWDALSSSANERRDFIAGLASGELVLVRDHASTGLPDVGFAEPLLDEVGAVLVRGANACPDTVERNDGSRPGLVVGSDDGALAFYENVATGSTPAMRLVGVAESSGAAIDIPGACPVTCFCNGDSNLDLVVASSNGQVVLLRGTDDPLVFAAPEPLLTTPFAAGRLSVQVVDWDDSGTLDLLVGRADGTLSVLLNEATSREAFSLAAPLRLSAGDEKLVFSGAPAFDGFDVTGEDCAKDLVALDASGVVQVFPGVVVVLAPPTLLYPLQTTELTPDLQAFHEAEVELHWSLPVDLAGRTGRLRIELAPTSSFERGVQTLFVPEQGVAATLPTFLADVPPLVEDGRVFWRARWESDRGAISDWSLPGSAGLPARGRNPVDAEPEMIVDGRARRGTTGRTSFANLKVEDAADTERPAGDVYEQLVETPDTDGYRLRWQYDLDIAPLAGRAHVQLLVIGKSTGDEKVAVSLWNGAAWRAVGFVPTDVLGTLTVDVASDEIVSGRVAVLLEDAGADPRVTTVELDQVALVDQNRAPTAEAGDEQTMLTGATAALDASASLDPDGDELTFEWVQLAGPQVLLEPGADIATPTFQAPFVTATELLVFRASVSDGELEDADEVTVRIQPQPAGTIVLAANPGAPLRRYAPAGGTGVEAMSWSLTAESEETLQLERVEVDALGSADVIAEARLVVETRAGRVESVGVSRASGFAFEGLDVQVEPGGRALARVEVTLARTVATPAAVGLLGGFLLVPMWRRRRRALVAAACFALFASACAQAVQSYSEPLSVSLALRSDRALSGRGVVTARLARIEGAPIQGTEILVQGVRRVSGD